MAEYSFTREPRERAYHRLIDYAFGTGATGLLVVRHLPKPDQSCVDFVSELQPYVLSATERAEWPGTRLMDDVATVYTLALNYRSAELLKYTVSGLYGWELPELPEDLCVLRDDGSPVLGSIAHEREGWLSLTDTEHQNLLREWPDLHALLGGPE